MLYRVEHATRYRYDAPVSQCQSEVRLTPRSLPWQTVLDTKIESVPAPAWVGTRKDYFGNDVCSFWIQERHDRFSTIATSRVEVTPRPSISSDGLSWEEARARLTEHATPDALEAFEFVFDSALVKSAPALAEYARPSFAPGRPLVAAVEELSHRIYTEFTYKPDSTSIDTPPIETLRLKRGVCQDFSHVMIGALRSYGLAARYVSGYLRSGTEQKGSEASHAWVGVFVPGVGWLDLDPTNDVRPDVNHVTIAWGRDYADVTPMKGIALGGGNQLVDVDVRVRPVD
ncbi:MAG TPA: transglutaminase family protein [Vicinamibacterales bacterium]|nr:transglutaminase family protein [Vicinamibacterales bacterium]